MGVGSLNTDMTVGQCSEQADLQQVSLFKWCLLQFPMWAILVTSFVSKLSKYEMFSQHFPWPSPTFVHPGHLYSKERHVIAKKRKIGLF